MSPTFYLSYKRLASEPGSLNSKSYNLTSEMRNQLLIVPAVMTLLYAGLKMNTPKSLEHDEKLASLIEYTLRFHMGAESGQANMAVMHGALTTKYGIDFKAQQTVNYLEGDLLVVPVTIMVTHMINACTLHASQGDLD